MQGRTQLIVHKGDNSSLEPLETAQRVLEGPKKNRNICHLHDIQLVDACHTKCYS